MFDLQKGPGKQPGKEEFLFVLEAEILENPGRKKELLAKIKEKVLMIQQVMRNGGSKELYEQANTLLQGYGSLVKAIARCKTKKS